MRQWNLPEMYTDDQVCDILNCMQEIGTNLISFHENACHYIHPLFGDIIVEDSTDAIYFICDWGTSIKDLVQVLKKHPWKGIIGLGPPPGTHESVDLKATYHMMELNGYISTKRLIGKGIHRLDMHRYLNHSFPSRSTLEVFLPSKTVQTPSTVPKFFQKLYDDYMYMEMYRFYALLKLYNKNMFVIESDFLDSKNILNGIRDYTKDNDIIDLIWKEMKDESMRKLFMYRCIGEVVDLHNLSKQHQYHTVIVPFAENIKSPDQFECMLAANEMLHNIPKTDTHLCEACFRICSKICSRCKSVWYCARKCQRLHWRAHKDVCVS